MRDEHSLLLNWLRIKSKFAEFGGETGGMVFGFLPGGSFFGGRAQECSGLWIS